MLPTFQQLPLGLAKLGEVSWILLRLIPARAPAELRWRPVSEQLLKPAIPPTSATKQLQHAVVALGSVGLIEHPTPTVTLILPSVLNADPANKLVLGLLSTAYPFPLRYLGSFKLAYSFPQASQFMPALTTCGQKLSLPRTG